LNWSIWIRQTHRWVAIAFTVTVIANFVALARGTPPAWVTYSPLAPRLPAVYRAVSVRAAVYRQVAQRQEERGASSMNKNPTQGATPSKKIDARIKELDDWRGKTLARLRAVIKQADPDVVEEWKWNVPVWSHDGLICTGESYKSAVKLTFAKGASLKDPAKLFNSSLEGNTRRAIDFREGDEIDADALKALIRAAVAQNKSAR
jgi:hypothetical protein